MCVCAVLSLCALAFSQVFWAGGGSKDEKIIILHMAQAVLVFCHRKHLKVDFFYVNNSKTAHGMQISKVV